MPIININADSTHNIDLGDVDSMTISSDNGTAEVYVDYKLPNDTYSSAIKGSAGYGNPFNVTAGITKTVNKSDLESEHVRVGCRDNNITVNY